MKKSFKAIVIAIVTFFAVALPVFAKSMSVQELEREIDAVQPDAGYAYIIGQYVFTSKYNLQLKDIVLASTSLTTGENKTDASQMKIYQLVRQYNNMFQPSGWEEGTPVLGSGNVPETMDIRYIDYKHYGEASNAKIGVSLEEDKYKTYTDVLEKSLKFKSSDFYADKLTEKDGIVSGLLLKKSVSDISYNVEDQKRFANAKYFFAYILEIPGATNETTIKVSQLDGTSVEVGLDELDVKVGEKDKTPGIVVLVAIDPAKWDESTKKITAVVDLDGDGDLYDPVEQSIDVSGLTFQVDSSEKVSLEKDKATEADKKILKEDYGYNSSLNGELTFTPDIQNPLTIKLTGDLIEQTLKKEVYDEGQETGYYFDFTFVLTGADKDKVKVELLKDSEGKQSVKTYQKSEYDENGNLTILNRIDPSVNCTEEDNKCTISYRVDLDGDGKEYLPVIYTIDYSGATLKKSSVFTVEAIEDVTEDDPFGDDAWHDTDGGYSVTVEQDESDTQKYYVSGILPVLEDSDWEGGSAPEDLKFDSGLYYLGLKLTLLNGLKDFVPQNSTINVKFDHEQNQPSLLGTTDFADSNILYLLKALKASAENGGPLQNVDKWFTITVDLDGDDTEYEPYTVTIDYSGLEFQAESNDAVDYDVIDVTTLEEDSPEKKELDSYDFHANGSELVTVKTSEAGGEDREPSKAGLTGTVREQKLNESAGFGDESGYFVPIKISLPTEEEWYQRHQNDWTITLYDENGSEQAVYKPKEYEHQQGWLLVLFKLDRENKNDDKLKFKLDFDGDGKAFLPYEYEISYSDLTFHSENQIKFEYFDETTGNVIDEPVTVYEGETIPTNSVPSFADKDYAYHDFDYWYKDNSETPFDFETTTTGKDENITLKAHWTIDVDKFFEDVVADLADPNSKISKDYSDVFEITKDGNTITFNVINSTTKLSVLKDTSIPGAIAYILQREEVKDITLSAGEKQVVFTKEGSNNQVIQKTALDDEGTALKERIKDGAQALFVDVLGGSEQEQNMTLNNMALAEENNNFTISIGSLDDTVKLTDEASKDYTFNFTTDVAAVNNEALLKQALQNESLKHIDITGDFNITSLIDISREVTINGAPDKSKYTLTANDNVETIFNVKSDGVSIDNIKLKGATKKSIVLESGSLTSTGLEIEYDSLPETFEAGIEATAGNLTVSDLKFEKETYDKPAVRTPKENPANINLQDSQKKKALRIEKEKINRVEAGNDTKNVDSEYTYYNYYNTIENSKIYETIFSNHEGALRSSYTKYNTFNETIIPPKNDEFKDFSYDGEDYKLQGYTENVMHVVTREEEEKPSDVIEESDLRATGDKRYWASFKVSIKEGAEKVSDAEQFKEALKKDNIKEIYITDKIEIDLTSETDLSNIKRDLSIVGSTDKEKRPTIKVKKLTLENTANDVFFNRINLVFSAEENQQSLIDVAGKKLSLWQTSIKNEGSAVDYAIKYNNDESVADIRWNSVDTDGFDPGNINKAYIDVEGKLAAGSRIYLNNFKKLGENGGSAIIIKEFANNAVIAGDIETPDISIENNTYGTQYGVKLLKESSGQNADIAFAQSSNATIAVEWDDTHKEFGGIKLHDANITKVKATYISESGETSDTPPTGGHGIAFVNDLIMDASGDYEEARINGLNKDENGVYSGTIIQSEDGGFYLPLVLTSEKFDDRVSQIKVTDPNDNEQEYLYSKYNKDGVAPINFWFKLSLTSLEESSPVGTMELNLEAIKTSKITGENGKQYTIDFDYDGDGFYEESSIINYSEVKTEEEIILEAAKNTQDATSLTVTKDNKIKGLEEKFSYKYDTEKDVTLYSENNQDKEYTFRYKKVDTDHAGNIIIAVRKSADGDTTTCKNNVCLPTINGWTFANFFSSVSRGYHELSLLQDLIKKDNQVVDAITKVTKANDQEHKYEVTLNKERLNEWLDNAYLSSEYYDKEHQQQENTLDDGSTQDNNVVVEVQLDNTDTYITSIKTKNNFSITSTDQKEYNDNKINVQFTAPNSTEIKEPLEFLSENGEKLDLQKIKDFYENCKKWHTAHTGSTIFEG